MEGIVINSKKKISRQKHYCVNFLFPDNNEFWQLDYAYCNVFKIKKQGILSDWKTCKFYILERT